jgi:hypothetical protein
MPLLQLAMGWRSARELKIGLKRQTMQLAQALWGCRPELQVGFQGS